MSKCDTCTHKTVCKHEKEMEQFEKEIKEKTKLMEYAEFSAKVECKHYRTAENCAKIKEISRNE